MKNHFKINLKILRILKLKMIVIEFEIFFLIRAKQIHIYSEFPNSASQFFVFLSHEYLNENLKKSIRP